MFRFTEEAIKILKSKGKFCRNPNYPRLFDEEGNFLWDKIIEESSKELERIEGLWKRFQEIVSKQIGELDLPLVLDAIYSEVNNYLVKKQWLARPLDIRQEGEMFRLIWSRNCLAESTNEADIQSLKTLIEGQGDLDLATKKQGLLDNKEIHDLVPMLQMKVEDIAKLKKQFMDGLYAIIKEVDLGEPLKGI
jgi:hypothetical protein